MSRTKDFLILLLALIIAPVAAGFFFLVAILGVVYSLVKHLIKGDYSSSRQLIPIIKASIYAADGIACAGSGELLNDVYKPKVKYGKWYHTISAITGVNYKKGQDTKLRRFLDWFEKDHCTKSITKEQETYYLKQNGQSN